MMDQGKLDQGKLHKNSYCRRGLEPPVTAQYRSRKCLLELRRSGRRTDGGAPVGTRGRRRVAGP